MYNLTVYPNNAPIVAKGAVPVPPGLFSQPATGRVSPVGNFTGFADSIEYFFALAPTPQGEGGLGIHEADVLEFTSGCPEVAASLVYLRTGHVDEKTGALDTSKPTSTLSQVAFRRFDDEGYDVKNFAIKIAAKVAPCSAIQHQCTGSNKQYHNELDCIARLQLKPFGSFDEAWGDNIACRAIHKILTHVRPEVHCPHVGPHGGSQQSDYKCVDIDYSKDYFDDGVLFGAPEGDVFTYGGPLLVGGT